MKKGCIDTNPEQTSENQTALASLARQDDVAQANGHLAVMGAAAATHVDAANTTPAPQHEIREGNRSAEEAAEKAEAEAQEQECSRPTGEEDALPAVEAAEMTETEAQEQERSRSAGEGNAL
eukprot:SAG31_NODE_20426_length_575_cov_0.615546_2_plen_121_part_01